MKKDIEMLAKFKLMDYSMLLAIEKRENTPNAGQRDNQGAEVPPAGAAENSVPDPLADPNNFHDE